MKKRAQSVWKRLLAQDGLAVLLAAVLLGTGLSFIYSASWRGEETGIVGAWFGARSGGWNSAPRWSGGGETRSG
ncbi:MAG TPA: hypothetical protein P5204_07715, partial [Kiritimatiellia bacterium]|nr:hypothetical protein [Kiritimatiellia bacterium]